MVEEQERNQGNSQPENRFLSNEEIATLAAVVQQVLERNGRGRVSELSNAQEENIRQIEEFAQSFKDSTAGPTRERLRESETNPKKLSDLYEDVPEWAAGN